MVTDLLKQRHGYTESPRQKNKHLVSLTKDKLEQLDLEKND